MLARIALRLATVEALKGATLVGGNVLDSQIAALDVTADGAVRTNQEKPFIAIYTDAASVVDRLDVRALHRQGQTDLTIETGITMSMAVTDPETGATEVIPGLPATDPAFEFYLDCVGRQVATALTDPRSAWAEIWRGLSSGIVKITRKRTSDAASGTRIAAHQLVITVDLLPDPVFGEPIAATSVWAKFLAQLQAVNHPYREAISTLMGESDGVLNHEAQRRRFGMTLDEARALMDIAVQPGEPNEPNLQSASSVDQIGV